MVITRDDARAVMIRMRELYITSRSRYLLLTKAGRKFVPKQDGRYKKLTDNILYGHVMQCYSIGIYASKGGSTFICFDVDAGGTDAVRDLISGIVAFGIAREMVHVSTSGGKGYHVEVFFDSPVALANLRWFYEWVTDTAALDRRKVELCPTDKQSIKLPLSIHPATGNICWFVDRETLEAIEDEAYIFSIKQQSKEAFLGMFEGKLLSERVKEKRPSQKREVRYPAYDLTNGYPDISQNGTRHDLMIAIAVDLRRKGVDSDECLSALQGWYERQATDCIKTTNMGVVKDMDDIVKWVYGDSFKTAGRACISRNDVLAAVAQDSRIRRKLYFAVLCACLCGERKISLRALASMTGISIVSLCRNIAELVAQEQILVTTGKRYCADGTFKAQANTYYVKRRAGTSGQGQIQISIAELWGDFDSIFYCAIHELLADTDRRYMTRLERQEYKQYIKSIEREGGDKDEDRRRGYSGDWAGEAGI